MLKALRITFVQALRSITLILLPLAFLSLLTWATAGSTSGNTADPIRAALWLFLVAHQIPLELSIADLAGSGSLSFLPLGALLIPFLAVRSGYRRALQFGEVATVSEKRRFLIAFALSYSTIGYLFSLPALGKTVELPVYVVIPILFLISFLIALFGGDGLPKQMERAKSEVAFQVAVTSLTALVGISSVLLGASLILNFEVVVNLIKVVEPGIFGGVALLLVQLLYIPNVAIGALSYFVGAGISISEGTLISPFEYRIDEIPAIPILGALPTTQLPFASLFALLVFAWGALVARAVTDFKTLIFTVLNIALLTFIIARAASGELISTNLPSVGPIWWSMPLFLTAEFAIGICAMRYIPRLIKRAKSDAI